MKKSCDFFNWSSETGFFLIAMMRDQARRPEVPEVRFVHAVTAGGSVNFFDSGVNFSIFTHFLCFITKTVEIRLNLRCKIFGHENTAV